MESTKASAIFACSADEIKGDTTIMTVPNTAANPATPIGKLLWPERLLPRAIVSAGFNINWLAPGAFEMVPENSKQSHISCNAHLAVSPLPDRVN